MLHYGGVPGVDLATWDLRVDGLVEQPLRLTHDDLKSLPRTELKADIHCVTRWSLLDSTWGGIALSEVLAEARVNPAATHVLVHAEHGYTTNLSLEDFLRPDNMLADTRNGVLLQLRGVLGRVALTSPWMATRCRSNQMAAARRVQLHASLSRLGASVMR